MSLIETIETVRKHIQGGEIRTESDVRLVAVQPILGKLGWNSANPRQVRSEINAGEGRADYALLGENRDPLVLIETKAYNRITENSINQLFQYAYFKGAGIIVLTDGQKWQLYLSSVTGVDRRDRLFCGLDLTNDSPSQCERLLFRYLDRGNTYGGKAFEYARVDFEARRETERRKQQEKRDCDKLENSLPRIWKELVEDSDSSLYELVSRKVVEAGLKEYPKVIEEFISRLRELGQVSPTNKSTPQRPQTAYVPERSPSIPPKRVNSTKTPRSKIVGYTLYDRKYNANRWNKVLVGVLNEFIARDPEFVSNFRRAHPRYWSNRRQLIADRQSEVYLKASHLMGVARQLNNGQWVDTNKGRDAIETLLKEACEVMGLQYGVDLVINYE